MRVARTICEQCGGTYTNSQAIGFSGFLTLQPGTGSRPDEPKQFCSLHCLHDWVCERDPFPENAGVGIVDWGGITHGSAENAQLTERWTREVLRDV